MDSSRYDADYFLRGKQLGISGYTNYRWLGPMLTIPMVKRIIEHLGIEKSDKILDYGCARGFVVRAFRELGYCAFGVDVSEWAIENADKRVRECVALIDPDKPQYVRYGDGGVSTLGEFDFVIAKDVLEHIPDGCLEKTISQLLDSARKGVFVVVPLSPAQGEPYVVPSYEQDITHTQRRDMDGWLSLLTRAGFETTGVYRVEGIKANYFKPGWEKGNAFITVRRVME